MATTGPVAGEALSPIHEGATLPPGVDPTVDLGSTAVDSSQPASTTRVRYFGDYEIVPKSPEAAWASSSRPGR